VRKLRRSDTVNRIAGRYYCVGMVVGAYRLGVDMGTSNTVAVLARPDGRAEPLLFDGAPILASGVCLTSAGDLVVGADAQHSSARRPEFLEPYPKQRIDEGTVLLGDVPVPVIDLLAAVLRRVGEEARRVAGAPIASVTLTHPASWGTHRREVLRLAARAAGLGEPVLVAEPVAAAAYFVHVLSSALAPGAALAIYDFGAGTFDASVVRREEVGGFATLAEQGRDALGGLDVDAAVLGYVGGICAEQAPDEWRRLVDDPAERSNYRALWDDVRAAKEMLSRTASSVVHVPVGIPDLPLGREEFDRLAQPLIAETVAATEKAIHAAGLTATDLAGLLLVGGSSRIPLAATLLHRKLGVAPIVLDQPELVVAQGALFAAGPPVVVAVPVVSPLPAPAVTTSPAPPGYPPVASAVPTSPAPPGYPPPAPAVPTSPAPAPPATPAPPSTRPFRDKASLGRPLGIALALAASAGLLAMGGAGRAALAGGVRAPFGPTGWPAVLGALLLLAVVGLPAAQGGLAAITATASAAARLRFGWLAATGSLAAAGYALAVAGSALLARASTGGPLLDPSAFAVAGSSSGTVEALRGTAGKLLVGVIVAGALAAALGLWLMSGRSARLGVLTRPPDRRARVLRMVATVTAGALLGVGAQTHVYGLVADPAALTAYHENGDTGPASRSGLAALYPWRDTGFTFADQVLDAGGLRAVVLGLLFAAGVAATAIAVLLCSAWLWRLLARASRPVRAYTTGAAYGLCVAVGVALAYHGVTELRYWSAWQRGGDGYWQRVAAPTEQSIVPALWLAAAPPMAILVAAGALASVVTALRRRPGGLR
jgi:hypothetical protein